MAEAVLARPDLVAELLELVDAMAKVARPEDALQAVTQAAVRVLPGDHASIRMLDPSQRELLASARSGRGSHMGSLPLARGTGVAGWVLEHGKAALIDDVRKDPRFVAAMGQGFQIRSMIVEPLWSGGRVVGVLSVSSPESAAFQSSDALVARLLAACAVPLLERARRADVAPFDELTLAGTADSILPRIDAEIDRLRNTGRRFSVAVLALDAFESTVSAYGREVADRVLCVASDRVRANVRVFDGFARAGESDFTLVLTGLEASRAQTVCERIRAAIGEPMEPLEGAYLTVTASIGLATWDEIETASSLEQRARAAMSEAREAKGDQLRVV
jgi:diguanylate cyclase (GGDEF)-like protein